MNLPLPSPPFPSHTNSLPCMVHYSWCVFCLRFKTMLMMFSYPLVEFAMITFVWVLPFRSVREVRVDLGQQPARTQGTFFRALTHTVILPLHRDPAWVRSEKTCF